MNLQNMFLTDALRNYGDIFKQYLHRLHAGSGSLQEPLLHVRDEAPYNLYLAKMSGEQVTSTTVPFDVALVERKPSLTDRAGQSATIKDNESLAAR